MAAVVRTEPNSEVSGDKKALLAVLQYLRQNSYTGAEELLRKEANLQEEDLTSAQVEETVKDVTKALAIYQNAGETSRYQSAYSDLMSFVDGQLDAHKVELTTLLYPTFVHMYLMLVYNEHYTEAKEFFEHFHDKQEHYYEDDIIKLSAIHKKEHMLCNQMMNSFRINKFTIRMSRESYTHFKRYLQEKKHELLLTIVQEHFLVDVFEGRPRTRQQIVSTAGGFIGEAEKSANKLKVYYGLLREPDLNVNFDMDEDMGEGDGDKPKKKKPKKDAAFLRKTKADPNAPSNTRIPLPEITDNDKVEKVKILRDFSKRVIIGPENPPSVCFYTITNSPLGATSASYSDDSTLLAASFNDSHIRVWSITRNLLTAIKIPAELELLDRDSDDIHQKMMDETTGKERRVLKGHAKAVYACTFSPDAQYLISCSADSTIRLWSTKTWTCLVSYQGHNYPVWDVKFSKHGHYFASGSADKTARLWSTDHYQPLRIFAGHLSDVDCVQFHPNSNYIATGSSDRTIRLWDVHNGACVRILTGHKGPIHTLCFSIDGRYLTSGGSDKNILLWDLANGELITQLAGHTDTIFTLGFSRDGGILASGGLDNTVRIWDLNRIFEEQDSGEPITTTATGCQLKCYRTKNTPVLNIHFTRKNLLLATGTFESS